MSDLKLKGERSHPTATSLLSVVGKGEVLVLNENKYWKYQLQVGEREATTETRTINVGKFSK